MVVWFPELVFIFQGASAINFRVTSTHILGSIFYNTLINSTGICLLLT